ncbi:MAG: cation:proton antiporter, partial [Verrucomicrobiae bacterium]|nr:cation:proton antiporter [Verrucomicrobiae bacterium]
MTLLEIVALLITLAALFSYLNFRFIKLPTTIGVMLMALVFSLVLLGVGRFRPELATTATTWLQRFEFDDALLQGMLSFLLFAGALHINLEDLAKQKGVITALALGGVALSTFLFGTAIWWLLGWLGLTLSYAWCLLFGALISPTDPIAVMGILKSAGAPKSLETKIAGESLFNDGVGVVLFLVILGIATGEHAVSFSHIGLLLLEEAVGGAIFGLVAGYVTYRMLRSVDNYQVEVLLTLALVMGGYALASALHLSGPIAIVVAGLLIG